MTRRARSASAADAIAAAAALGAPCPPPRRAGRSSWSRAEVLYGAARVTLPHHRRGTECARARELAGRKRGVRAGCRVCGCLCDPPLSEERKRHVPLLLGWSSEKGCEADDARGEGVCT
jgi:hypothetical protein